MAEVIARRSVDARHRSDITVASAGTSAWDGAPASDGALLVALEHGLDLNGHRATMLSRDLVKAASLILVMSPHHAERAVVLGGAGRTHLLTDFASRSTNGQPVQDPFGGELDQYRRTFDELTGEISAALDRIAGGHGADTA